MRRAARLGALALASALAACASPGRRVDASGWAAVEAGDRAGARKRALADAQRAAVEKAAGVTVSATTEIRDAAVLSEDVRARTRGRLVSYEVLGEREEAGGLAVRIRAEVAPSQDAAPCPSAPLAVSASDARTESALRRGLLASGCALAGPGEEARLLLRGRSRVFAVTDVRIEPFLSYGAQLDVQAVDAASGRVVWDGGARAAALGGDAGAAADSALAEAAASAAADAVRALASSY